MLAWLVAFLHHLLLKLQDGSNSGNPRRTPTEYLIKLALWKNLLLVMNDAQNFGTVFMCPTENEINRGLDFF